MRLFAAIAVALLLAGCSSQGATVTEAQARSAAQKLESDMGPSGAMSSMTMEMDMTMSGEMEGQSMDMEMSMSATMEIYRGDAFLVTVGDVSMSGMGASMSGLEFRIFCSPERLVMETEGMDAMAEGAEDFSLETENIDGACLGGDGPTRTLARLMSRMGGSGVPMDLSSTMKAPDIEFVKLEGRTATYRMDMGGMGGLGSMGGDGDLTAKATFAEGGRIAELEADMDLEMEEIQMSMHMDLTMEFEYGSRGNAPDMRGDDQV